MGRPAPKFGDFIGQRRTVAFVRRTLEGAQARGEPFPHALVHGPSGVGKTLLGRAVASEMGTGTIAAMGYDNLGVLSEKLRRLALHDILLVDEAHRLGNAEQEMFLGVIDDLAIPGPAAGERVDIPAATLVLATDQPGRLLPALIKRLLDVPLFFYAVDELKAIVEVMAGLPEINVLLTPQAARRIAEVSGGLPRLARQHLVALRLMNPDAEKQALGQPDVQDYLDARGFDSQGLGLLESRYLEVVARAGAASLETIALSLGRDERYVRQQIEEPLVRRGLIRITINGRQLGPAGREWADRRGGD
jgi:Holliday junction DNA helicase RuvB